MSADVMLDLETLSSQPDAAIISIGACTFRTDGTAMTADERKLFTISIDMVSSQRAGGHVDAGTIRWWLQQSDAARAAVTGSNSANVAVALQMFRSWLLEIGPARIWGNGAGFDNIILRQAYQRLQMEAPWGFYQDRCYRTLKNLRGEIQFTRMGIAHSALDDAVSQAMHAERLFAAMRGEA